MLVAMQSQYRLGASGTALSSQSTPLVCVMVLHCRGGIHMLLLVLYNCSIIPTARACRKKRQEVEDPVMPSHVLTNVCEAWRTLVFNEAAS
jgi:hypothetical protein